MHFIPYKNVNSFFFLRKNQLLIHRDKEEKPNTSFYYYFLTTIGANWIMSRSVRDDMLLGWKCAFVVKRRKKV